MKLKSIILAAGAMLTLAAPAAAFADAYWGHDRGYHDGWRGDDDAWRRHEWREHEAWEHRARFDYDAPRCVIENRGYYAWDGDWVNRPGRVCYR